MFPHFWEQNMILAMSIGAWIGVAFLALIALWIVLVAGSIMVANIVEFLADEKRRREKEDRERRWQETAAAIRDEEYSSPQHAEIARYAARKGLQLLGCEYDDWEHRLTAVAAEKQEGEIFYFFRIFGAGQGQFTDEEEFLQDGCLHEGNVCPECKGGPLVIWKKGPCISCGWKYE